MSDAPDTATRLAAAVKALQEGNDGTAEPLLAAVLAGDPDQPDALHFLGVLRHRQGDAAAGTDLIRRAAAMAPNHAGIEVNLGNVLFESGETAAAIAAYRRALAIDSRSSQAWHNLGTALHSSGDLAQARLAAERAVELDAGNAEAWYGLSRTLIDLGQVHEGLLANSRAVTLWPHHLLARDQVLRALVMLGEHDAAERLYREWLDEDPDNPVVVHQLAAIGREPVPARADDSYVEAVFDSFAPTFDTKLAALGYRAPHLVADALATIAPPASQWDIADLGCGTGLCGALVRPWARRLVGCDLSTGMLTRAHERGGYDALFKVELVYFLEHEPQSFDVLVSADTLCYFGPLDQMCHAAAGALRPCGHAIFTVEALVDDDGEGGGGIGFAIQPTGRYAHDRRYVGDVLSGAGFVDVATDPVELRTESGLPVAGWLVIARR